MISVNASEREARHVVIAGAGVMGSASKPLQSGSQLFRLADVYLKSYIQSGEPSQLAEGI